VAARRGARHLAGVIARRRGAATFSEKDLEEMFLVGTPGEVREQLIPCMRAAQQLGCEQIVLGVPVGPTPLQDTELLVQEAIPPQHMEAMTTSD
jgi:hypothetical protein